MTDIVSNWKVYGLEDSIKASKYPMSVDVNKCTPDITHRTHILAKCSPGTGHDQFLTGIICQFDLTLTIKAWVEAQRYHFLDFVSSQSTMHKIHNMSFDKQCISYVTPETIANCEKLLNEYSESPSTEGFLKLIYNVPVGFRLTARMTTNFRQLKTIYQQRKTHRLPEWRWFCEWIEGLPCADFITGGNEFDT